MIPVSLYGLDGGRIFDALKRAAARGVEIRMVLDSAAEDRSSEGETISGRLEQAGIDVRFVNKTNHHKFMTVDKKTAYSGSGNWSVSANFDFDENALWFDDEGLIKRFRAEFALQWINAREFGATLLFKSEVENPELILQTAVSNPGRDVVFSSSNFDIRNSSQYGPTFVIKPNHQVVADRLVSIINGASSSIHVAVTHLRSRPIAEALIAKKKSNPSIDIQVVLDSQEYISPDYEQIQLDNRSKCLAEASTSAQREACWDSGFYYSYELAQAGIDVRFKVNSYSWDYDTALQMHHKYMVVDSSIVATGSYNYSNNAEKNSFENVVVLEGNFAPDVVQSYEHNFQRVRNYGRSANFYLDVFQFINSNKSGVPLQYPIMALTYQELTDLKNAVEKKLPAVKDAYFKRYSNQFSELPSGLDWKYLSSGELDLISGKFGAIRFGYEENSNKLAAIDVVTADDQTLSERFSYGARGKVDQYHGPSFSAQFGYNEADELVSLNYGTGYYRWNFEASPSGKVVNFSTPNHPNYRTEAFNWEGFLESVTDANHRSLSWEYDRNWNPTKVMSSARSVWLDEQSESQFSHVTSDGQTVKYDFSSAGRIALKLDGTIKANINYDAALKEDDGLDLNLSIESLFVDNGYGKAAAVHYAHDAYGRTVVAGNNQIRREPYSGQIKNITNGDVLDQRRYQDGKLMFHEVQYKNTALFSESFDYDDLGRIKSSHEVIKGTAYHFEYRYYPTGALRSVLRNGVESEQYVYDDWGNRLERTLPNVRESYHYDSDNRLTEKRWKEAGRERLISYVFNQSGQLQQARYFTVSNGVSRETRSKRFDYNELGQLPVVAWANQERRHVYDPYDRQIATLQNGVTVSRYVYGLDDQPVAEINANGRIVGSFIYGDDVSPIGILKGNKEYYIAKDIRGSVRMVVDTSNGEIAQSLQYDAFGRVTQDTRPGFTPFGFAGGLYDSSLGLLRFGARDYDPENGRWLSEDPIGFASGDINFYAYVGNDPINYVDPDGLSKVGSSLQYPKDYSTSKTLNKSGKYKSEREARNTARQKLGKNPIKVEENKYRSRDGKWQYRGKPEDLRGHGPNDSPHIHLERINPLTGEVLANWHLRW